MTASVRAVLLCLISSPWIPAIFLMIAGQVGLAGELPRPNFLIILTDDQGYGDVSTYRPADLRTPNIDRIAAEGMLFENMRANCTVCSPSRAALLTGRYADRVGVPGVIRTNPADSWGYLDPKVPTLAKQLKQAGYYTGIVGNWDSSHLTCPTNEGLIFSMAFSAT
jgi:arylsulfatase A-like enzyme